MYFCRQRSSQISLSLSPLVQCNADEDCDEAKCDIFEKQIPLIVIVIWRPATVFYQIYLKQMKTNENNYDDDDGSAYCDPLSPEVTGILSDLPPTPPTLHILSLPYSFPKLNTRIFIFLYF